MARRNRILDGPKDARDKARHLLESGVSLLKVSQATGFTLSEIRTFKKHIDEGTPLADSTLAELKKQNARLHTILALASSDDSKLELRLKVEKQLADNVKSIHLIEERAAALAPPPETPQTAQISSVVAVISKVLQPHPDLKNEILAALSELNT